MWVIMKYGKIICPQKFKFKEDAEIWCLHNGYAKLKTVNKLGDKIISLHPSVHIEKMG